MNGRAASEKTLSVAELEALLEKLPPSTVSSKALSSPRKTRGEDEVLFSLDSNTQTAAEMLSVINCVAAVRWIPDLSQPSPTVVLTEYENERVGVRKLTLSEVSNWFGLEDPDLLYDDELEDGEAVFYDEEGEQEEVEDLSYLEDERWEIFLEVMKVDLARHPGAYASTGVQGFVDRWFNTATAISNRYAERRSKESKGK